MNGETVVKWSGLDSTGSWQIPLAGSCEHGVKTWDPIKGKDFSTSQTINSFQ